MMRSMYSAVSGLKTHQTKMAAHILSQTWVCIFPSLMRATGVEVSLSPTGIIASCPTTGSKATGSSRSG